MGKLAPGCCRPHTPYAYRVITHLLSIPWKIFLLLLWCTAPQCYVMLLGQKEFWTVTFYMNYAFMHHQNGFEKNKKSSQDVIKLSAWIEVVYNFKITAVLWRAPPFLAASRRLWKHLKKASCTLNDAVWCLLMMWLVEEVTRWIFNC